MTNETEAPEYERKGSLATYNLMDALKRNALLIQAGADICAEAVSTIDAQAARIAEYEVRLRELEAELHMMKNAGIIEVAVRNSSVLEYMEHWEARAEAAEAKLAKAAHSLRECILEMGVCRVFVNSRQMTKQPEGAEIYEQVLDDARTTLAELKGGE